MTTIVRTYARQWTDSRDATLPLLRELTGAEPALRLAFESIELAAIGDFLVIAGPDHARAAYAHASATVVVTDLDALEATLTTAANATITTPATTGPTGRFRYARHAGGSEIEYVGRVPELVERLVRPWAPLPPRRLAQPVASSRHTGLVLPRPFQLSEAAVFSQPWRVPIRREKTLRHHVGRVFFT
ncbi:hypothetical protein FHS42_002976 [Streptomyces zagrosensis]|uniref:Uncharacterized protein n=1 Tax=Streptomyces zagrosensis TaxID=1042984 RepID=A0A7W9QAY6_9ACTN|nr:hypothetical protein [Streptomyces zagrosensis]